MLHLKKQWKLRRRSLENYKRLQIFQSIIESVTHNWGQKVICVVISIVIVQLYNASLLERRYLSCHVEYKYSDSLISSTTLPRTVRVSLWGNTSIINSIRDEDIIARVDASQLKLEGEYRLPIQFIKNNSILNGQAVELHAESSEIKMRLEEKMLKTVDVKLALDGNPQEDYGIIGTVVEPIKVNIEGPISRVEKIEGLTTELVQVDNRSDDIDGFVSLINNDPLISIVGQSTIKYKVEIKEKELKHTESNVDIYIKNLDSNLEIVSSIPKGVVNIRGRKKVIAGFSKPRDLLYIDLKNLQGEGEYTTIPVQYSRLNNLQIESYEPKSIRLVVKLRNKEDSIE